MCFSDGLSVSASLLLSFFTMHLSNGFTVLVYLLFSLGVMLHTYGHAVFSTLFLRQFLLSLLDALTSEFLESHTKKMSKYVHFQVYQTIEYFVKKIG